MGRFGRSVFALALLFPAACRPASSVRRPAGRNGNGVAASELKMTQMNAQSYGANGLEWELATPYAEMFTSKNLMRVRNMNVRMFENGQRSSDLSAQQGVVSMGPKSAKYPNADLEMIGVPLEDGDMFARGDVVMVSTDGSKLNTDWIHYHKKTDLITSTAPVSVLREDSITHGVGMEARSDLSNVKIFNQTLVIPEKKKQ